MELSLSENKKFLVIDSCTEMEYEQLKSSLTKKIEGWRFHPLVKKKVWDGKVRLYNQVSKELNVGLWQHLKKFCADRFYPLQIIDNEQYGHPELKNTVKHQELVKYLESLGAPFDVRDYQYDAISYGIQNKRCILLSPTGSGKSFIIYNLMRWYTNA